MLMEKRGEGGGDSTVECLFSIIPRGGGGGGGRAGGGYSTSAECLFSIAEEEEKDGEEEEEEEAPVECVLSIPSLPDARRLVHEHGAVLNARVLPHVRARVKIGSKHQGVACNEGVRRDETVCGRTSVAITARPYPKHQRATCNSRNRVMKCDETVCLKDVESHLCEALPLILAQRLPRVSLDRVAAHSLGGAKLRQILVAGTYIGTLFGST